MDELTFLVLFLVVMFIIIIFIFIKLLTKPPVEPAETPSSLVKIVPVGDEKVGKTTLLRRYLGEGFQKSYLMTIGADFGVKMIEVGGQRIKFQLWELATQPRFQVVRESYYRGALGCLLMFDVTNWDSFQSLPRWIDDVWQFNGRGCIPVVLVGNKVDLHAEGVESVPQAEGMKYAQAVSEVTRDYGFSVPYIEISVKTGERVEEAFHTLGSNIIAFVAHGLRIIKSLI